MNTEALKTLIDLGGQAVLLFLLWQVWQRLNIVTDKLTNLLQQMAEDRFEARQQREELKEAVIAQNDGHRR